MLKQSLAAVAATLFFALPAHAGPAADKASARFAAIGAGDLATVSGEYADNATLHWVGGPLDGTYTGAADLKALWAKFSGAQGRLEVSVSNVQESANPKGTTVSANVQFKGQNTIKVRYVLLYRDGKLVNEIWQVDPNLTVAAY
ncbi:MAG: nuclear transport factor 2 family protein [Rhodospirillales bacterium]|nr:nuclear transport factor 2 family protein [Rhodospirillales bacterium]